MREHVDESEPEVVRAVADTVPTAVGGSPTVSLLHGLQAGAGNRAVAGYLGRRVLMRDAVEVQRAVAQAEFRHAVAAKLWARAAIVALELDESGAVDVLSSMSPEQRAALERVVAQKWPDLLERMRELIAKGDALRVARLNADYAAAVKAGDWNRAATLLNAFSEADIAVKLKALQPDELRQLDAGALRAIGAFAERVHRPIMSILGTSPGQAFGKTIVVQTPKDGSGWKDDYWIRISITFDPDEKIVRAKEIGFLQAVRMTQPGQAKSYDKVPGHADRLTGELWAIDRVQGKKWAWYGVGNEGSQDTNFDPGSSPPKKAAVLRDKPIWNVPNIKWEFETAIICKEGPDQGVVYGVVLWGFDVDAGWAVTPHQWRMTDKPSASWRAAVAAWNAQAATWFYRSDKDQQPLPQFR